ncbi:GGDEF domain-containing protein [Psychromonas sp. KJ10-10]|uniref:GGDEF domain-containing protein n=1 Tax=Psychromonas sp. KJ10-10 TaxID=3391823 RepID=UPI0039B42D6A
MNDKYGHSMGDKTLTELSKLFKAQVREQDCIARWGGEEFLFIFPETTIEHTYMIALKIQVALEKHEIKCKDKPIKVTVSMGISKLDSHKTIDQAINTADKYLYQAKNAGRNKILPHFN